ncbi:MAG: hypothetical protein JOY51_04745, partial [Nevskia sp.]|nr:hypothetical protein [Nevskia sp.]
MELKAAASGKESHLAAALAPTLASVALVIAALVLATNFFLVRTSSIANVDELRYDLAGLDPQAAPANWTGDWLWHQPAPYKYRLLGKLPLWAAAAALEQLGVGRDLAFYYSFIACLLAGLFLAL